jgi:heme/copper-type cytochrome/quinol oxidase subunit 1
MLQQLSNFIKRWFFSNNQKNIGTLYFFFGTFAGVIGIVLFIVIRFELSYPGTNAFFRFSWYATPYPRLSRCLCRI